MSNTGPRKKKVVKASQAPLSAPGSDSGVPDWKPTPESKKSATNHRIIALVLWVLAIGLEAIAIFWLLPNNPPHLMWWLIGTLVVIAGLAIAGSLLWKKANRLDPASKKDTVRFWIQNQLGLIISIIAFLPLIILIFTNKDMDAKQKGIAGGIGIVLLLVAGYFGTDFDPASQEDYAAQTALVVELKGNDEVTWTKSGGVYHLCEDASAVQRESQDGQIIVGTVGQANAEGKTRLTRQVETEMNQCNYPLPENFEEILEKLILIADSVDG